MTWIVLAGASYFFGMALSQKVSPILRTLMTAPFRAIILFVPVITGIHTPDMWIGCAGLAMILSLDLPNFVPSMGAILCVVAYFLAP
jgi:hypothetical protein